MALHVRKSYYNPSFGRAMTCDEPLTNIDTREIFKASRLVSTMTGMTVQANKAIVGANAFAHESGIHQDGMLKNKATYEIMDPALIGLKRADSDAGIVMGKHSGRHALKTKLMELGYEMGTEELNELFPRRPQRSPHAHAWGHAESVVRTGQPEARRDQCTAQTNCPRVGQRHIPEPPA